MAIKKNAYNVDTYKGPFAGLLRVLTRRDADEWEVADTASSEVNRKANGTVPKAEWERLQAALDTNGFDLKANTIRLYVAVAMFWPKAKRIAGASFTAHKRAQRAGDLTKATAVLTQVGKANGGRFPERAVVEAVDALLGTSVAKSGKTQAKATAASQPAANVDPLTAAMAAINAAIVADVIGQASASRLADFAKVLASAATVVTKAQARQQASAQPAKVGRQAKASQPAKPATKPAAQPVGMRG